MSDERLEPSESFALRHQARRASALADLLREKWDAMDEDLYCAAGMDLPDAAAALSDQGWANAADELADRTGKGFRPPSDTTRAITIGLLSAPTTRGLVH